MAQKSKENLSKETWKKKAIENTYEIKKKQQIIVYKEKLIEKQRLEIKNLKKKLKSKV